MPEEVIPILRVRKAADAVAWFARMGFRAGIPAFVSIARGNVRLFLSEHQGDARPDTLVYLRVNDVRSVAQEFSVEVQEPPWGPTRSNCEIPMEIGCA